MSVVGPGPRVHPATTARRLRARRAHARRAHGFTMIEALLAGMILALAGVAIGTGVTQSLRSLGRSESAREASQLLDRTLTRIDTVGPAQLLQAGPTEGQFEPPNQRYRWQADIRSLVETDLYEITVTITWADDAGQHQVEATTRLYDPVDSDREPISWENL